MSIIVIVVYPTLLKSMTVYVNRRYRWQTIAQIGPQIREYDWLLRQKRDRYGRMFSKFVIDVDDASVTEHLLVLVQTTSYDDEESD